MKAIRERTIVAGRDDDDNATVIGVGYGVIQEFVSDIHTQ
jgi:hypothetical protein